MEFLDPDRHPVWKAQLLAGQVGVEATKSVARAVVAVHNASAGDAAVAPEFVTRDSFYALRLEPYLVATGRAHPDLTPPLNAMVQRTGTAQIALVHGDVSPKTS